MAKKNLTGSGEANEPEVEVMEQGDVPVGEDTNQRVKLEITVDDAAHFYEKGEIVECGKILASKIVKNGWGKIIGILLLGLLSFVGVQAQTSNYQRLYKVVSALPASAALTIYSDTVTNTATNYLTTAAMKNLAFATTINVLVTKISGTVAGTVTLQGSLDGTTYATVKNPTYAGTYTFTATDVATQVVSFAVTNNPYIYYRVSYTGVGTMAATIAAQVWSH